MIMTESERGMFAGLFKEALVAVDVKFTDEEQERLDRIKREGPRHTEDRKRAREARRQYGGRRKRVNG